jgi:hypothetical protein
MIQNHCRLALALAGLLPLLASTAQAQHSKMAHGKPSKMVAYDAKDKRFYSVAWAKAHGMHDKGGDPLTIVPMSSLPKEAKESKAMHGAKM